MRNAFIGTFLMVALAVGFVPTVGVVHAQDVGLCEQVSEGTVERVNENIDLIVDEIRDRHDTFLAGINDARDRAATETQSARDRWEEERDQMIETFLDQVRPNPDLETAADEFVAASNEARDARDLEVADARDTFLADMSATATELRDLVLTSIEDFRAEVIAAFEAAQDRCAEGVSNPDNQAQLRADLDAARADFRADRETFDPGSRIAPILQARREAQQAAKDVFIAAMEAARQDLQDAWEVAQGGDDPLE